MLAFGTTAAGMVNHFTEATAISKEYCFHEMPQSHYMNVFTNHTLGNVKLAEELQVNGSETILRGNLGAMLHDILGREPRKHELEAWFTFCDFDRCCTMDINEYERSIQQLVNFSAQPADAKTYTSWGLKETHRHQARLVENCPQSSLARPLTASQEVGWHAVKPGAAMREEVHCLNHTDVTKREGRTAATYFGHYTMQK
jgi:hypothetical protein